MACAGWRRFELAPHHGFCQLGHAGIARSTFQNNPTCPHDGHLIAKRQNLLELVGDDDDRLATFAQTAQHHKQLLRFLRCEHGGGLIQNQNARPAMQRFQYLQPLAISHRQFLHHGVQIDCKPSFLHQSHKLSPRVLLSFGQQQRGFYAEHHIV